MRWNLDEIYTGYESAAFISDTAGIAALAVEFDSWSMTGLSGDPSGVLVEGIKKLGEYKLLMGKAYGYCSLRNSTDADDAQALSWMERLAAADADAVRGLARFRQYLLGLGGALEDAIARTPALSEFSFFLMENRDYGLYMLAPDVEHALSVMEITGLQAWSNLQNTLASTLTVDMQQDGETHTLTLPMVRNLAYDADPETRRKAYEAELSGYPKIERGAAAALSGIKGESIAKCRMRGFQSPLDQTLLQSRMDRQTLDALIGSMEECLPLFRRYLKAKAKLLGKVSLPFYDLFAPAGKMDMRFTLEEARQYLVGSFRSFSDKMADFIDAAFENRWLDTEPRPGKTGGAFCHTVHAIGESRILSNFDGSFNSVSTLAHELGHGYHGLCLKDKSVLNADYPMPLAETASIFNETFIAGKALEDAHTAEERLALLDGQLLNATQVVVDILSRYYFETEVFERRKDSVPGAEEFKAMMLDAQRRTYGDGLDGDLLHPYMWVCKSHYYMGINYYNFPYAFGLLFGLGIYGLYRENGTAFLPVYDGLLASTGSDGIAAVCASVGIDVRDTAFWRGSLDVVKDKIIEYERLAAGVNT